jgi:hypothetical protein
MRKLVRVALVLVVLVTAGVAILLTAAYRATQQVPEFYQHALAQQPREQKAAADQLERQVLELHNEARRPGRWEARFSQEQINGWLAADLPTKFPGALPDGVSAPRVAIDPNHMQLAVRYDKGDVSTVLSMAGDAYLTDQPNEVAVHIDHVRAGAFPVPLAQFLDDIAERFIEAGLPLDRKEFKGQQLQVERLEICDGEIVVSGRTDAPAAKSAEAEPGEGEQSIQR